MLLRNVTIFEVAVGATVLAVEVKVEHRYQLPKYLHLVESRAHGFQI